MRHSVKKLHKLWAKSYMIQGQGHHDADSHVSGEMLYDAVDALTLHGQIANLSGFG